MTVSVTLNCTSITRGTSFYAALRVPDQFYPSSPSYSLLSYSDHGPLVDFFAVFSSLILQLSFSQSFFHSHLSLSQADLVEL